MSLLAIDHLGKTYGSGDDAVVALADVHFDVAEGEFVTSLDPLAAARPRCFETSPDCSNRATAKFAFGAMS